MALAGVVGVILIEGIAQFKGSGGLSVSGAAGLGAIVGGYCGFDWGKIKKLPVEPS